VCGICGIYHFGGGTAGARALRAMSDVVVHRGPDGEGFHVAGPVGLGMRRLAIIDLVTGDQPHYNEDRSVAVVCNGEIYNYRELRAVLASRGHTLRTRSDVEVIAHLYEDHGAGCLQHLRGMFTVAIWDAKARRLVLARDRLGIKPAYYAVTGGTLLFASELKSIFAYPGFRREVDTEALHHYLSLNYVPAPYTLARGVRQLPPGEYLTCDEGGIAVHPYWDLRFHADETLGEREWARSVRDALEDAVASHLVSDVPFGAFLSGGIDSSAVVAFMSRALSDPVRTFSIDFAEESFSEATFAELVARRFGTEHHVATATPELVSLLDVLVWHADDCLADSSMIPVYLVARFAREAVTMVLTGDGGDEVFAGYPTYNAYWVRRWYRRLPAAVRRHVVRRVVEALPVSLSKVSFDFKARRFVEGAELDAEEAHYWWRAILSESGKAELYSDAMRASLDAAATSELYRRSFRAADVDDALSRMLYVDTRLYLPADMLVKVDRMTMANALEARVPFLDHPLVELAARVPSAVKFKRRRQKYILKKALEGIVPPQVLRRRKAGFNVPVNAWLAGPLREHARSVLSPERVRAAGFFRPAVVERLLDEHTSRRRDNSFPLWGLMCFQLWYERFIAPETISPPPAVAERWGIPVASSAEGS
jgi:asparagine synthase (glutamine-hydrolysing)